MRIHCAHIFPGMHSRTKWGKGAIDNEHGVGEVTEDEQKKYDKETKGDLSGIG